MIPDPSRSYRRVSLRLTAPYLLSLVLLGAALYSISVGVVEDVVSKALSATLARQAKVAGELLPWNAESAVLQAHCVEVAGKLEARITVVGDDGSILCDSIAAGAIVPRENIRDRPEIAEALRAGSGEDFRHSPGTEAALLYRAWRQERDGSARVIRVAVEPTVIAAAETRLAAATLIALLAAGAIALVPVLMWTRRLARRLSALAVFSAAVADEREPPPLAPAGADSLSGVEANLLRMQQTLGARLQAARAEKSKLQAVLGGMVEGVLVIDGEGIIELANERAAQLLSAPGSAALVGAPVINVSRDPDLQAVVREAIETAPVTPIVAEITFRTGERVEALQLTASTITGGPQERPLFILVFHDVTELKKLEAARRDFVANVSHEIRTPLTAIRGYAETLRAGALDDAERARKFLGVIERHSERLTRLTDDLLALSDLELGRAALHKLPMSVAPAVEAAFDVVREKAEQRGVAITREIAADLPSLTADADRVVQVLVNLIDNAVKYTEGGGKVTVSVDRSPNPDPTAAGNGRHDWLELRIADTGVGIPSRDLPRLTERFYRVDKARSRELGGTGLGLAIVKHIVQAHNGVLRFDSELGKGTTVRVFLPLTEA